MSSETSDKLGFPKLGENNYSSWSVDMKAKLITNTELVRFRYFVGTQNQLQWHCKCCVCNA